jgi:broad specificity phosphatase PhoE
MAPKIHLVRHAQGLHNVTTENTKFSDPLLTPKGKQQCTELQRTFPHHRGIDLIVSSPIRRTLYTSLLSFHDDIKTKGLRIIALPELQETTALPCDTGSHPVELDNEFAGEPIDFALVQPGWNDKTAAKWAVNDETIARRAQEAREWLYQRQEMEIVVVTHGSFRSLDDTALIAAIVVSCVTSLPPMPLPLPLNL